MTHESHPIETEIQMLPFQPFYFDPEQMKFIVGFSGSQKTFGAGELDDVFDMEGETFDLATDENPYSLETIVQIKYGPLVQMGEARKVLQKVAGDPAQKEEFSKKVIDVMEAVYKLRAPQVKIPQVRGGADPYSFNLSFLHDGKFIVRTFGDCACLGPVYPERYISIPNGADNIFYPVEIGLNNVFSEAQRLSLYAGAGTIGWMTKQTATS